MAIAPIEILKAAVVVRSRETGVLADARRLTLPPAPELSPVHRDKSYLGPRAPLTTEIPTSCIISAARAVELYLLAAR